MTFKKFLAALLALSLVLGLAACGGSAPAETTAAPTEAAANANEADYTVRVVNAKGKPYTSGIIVRFMKGAEQVTMQVIDENGAAVKTLPKDDYTVELMFTDSNAQYVYGGDLTLSAEKTQLEISLAYAAGDHTIPMYFQAGGEGSGLVVDVCCTQVELTAGERNYFLFVPKEAGKYEISAVGDVESIGLYGTPYFVLPETVEPVENNTLTTDIRADQIGSGDGGSTILVVGIDAGAAESCVLSIERIGDPDWTPEDEPYVIYQKTVELAPYTLPAGASLKEFDPTADTDAYSLVLGSDGFYHLDSEDGPLVLMLLGKANKYTDCFQTFLTKSGVRKYFYDENGEFDHRESYDECLREYFTVMDEANGVYPLTEDLRYIVWNRGDYAGWWDMDGNTHVFYDENGMPVPDINPEIAWLFMCVYIG